MKPSKGDSERIKESDFPLTAIMIDIPSIPIASHTTDFQKEGKKNGKAHQARGNHEAILRKGFQQPVSAGDPGRLRQLHPGHPVLVTIHPRCLRAGDLRLQMAG